MQTKTLVTLLRWARENITEGFTEIRTVGDGLYVRYQDGRVGCLYMGADGEPRVMAPAL